MCRPLKASASCHSSGMNVRALEERGLCQVQSGIHPPNLPDPHPESGFSLPRCGVGLAGREEVVCGKQSGSCSLVAAAKVNKRE